MEATVEEWAYIHQCLKQDIEQRKRYGLKTDWEESVLGLVYHGRHNSVYGNGRIVR